MTLMELVGLNVKWYRYKNCMTQEQYAKKAKMKVPYVSTVENGNANLTCKSIEFIAKTFHIKPEQLFNEQTAKSAKKLPIRLSKDN